MNIQPPSPSEPVLEDNLTMAQRFRAWTQLVSRLGILEGSGSPDGVIKALPTKQYMDTAGGAGTILYIKQVADIGGDKTLGWVLV